MDTIPFFLFFFSNFLFFPPPLLPVVAVAPNNNDVHILAFDGKSFKKIAELCEHESRVTGIDWVSGSGSTGSLYTVFTYVYLSSIFADQGEAYHQCPLKAVARHVPVVLTCA